MLACCNSSAKLSRSSLTRTLVCSSLSRLIRPNGFLRLPTCIQSSCIRNPLKQPTSSSVNTQVRMRMAKASKPLLIVLSRLAVVQRPRTATPKQSCLKDTHVVQALRPFRGPSAYVPTPRLICRELTSNAATRAALGRPPKTARVGTARGPKTASPAEQSEVPSMSDGTSVDSFAS